MAERLDRERQEAMLRRVPDDARALVLFRVALRGLPAMARPIAASIDPVERDQGALCLFRFWIGVAAWEASECPPDDVPALEHAFSDLYGRLLLSVQELEFRLGPTIALSRRVNGTGEFQGQFFEAINRMNAYARGASGFDTSGERKERQTRIQDRITGQLVAAVGNDLDHERSSMRQQPLWVDMPDGFARRLDELWQHLTPGGGFEFWRRWYQGFVNGTPIDVKLARRVAGIPHSDWEQGARHVSRMIEEIEARFALTSRIAELEQELQSASANRHGIGGNNPPDPIEPDATPTNDLVVVWEPLIQLRNQAQEERPDKTRVRAALEALTAALKSGLLWCAGKADLAVDTAIKWAVPALGGGYFAMNPDKLVAVIDAAKAWLATLP